MGAFDDIMGVSSGPARGPFDDIMGISSERTEPAGAVTPDMNAPPETWGQYAEGLAARIGEAVTFDFGDEIAAAAGSLGGLGPSLLGTKTYSQILKEEQEKADLFKARHPKTALAADIGGSLVPGAGGVRFIMRAPGWVSRAARSAAVAAPMGATSEVGRLRDAKDVGDYAEAALEGGARSAAVAGGLSAAGTGVGAVVGPWASAAAQRLSDRGIRLTPGELLGPYAKRLEDTFTSLPVVNRFVRTRQQEGIEDFNRVVLNDALNELNRGIGPQLATRAAHLPPDMPAGRGAIHHARIMVRDAYQQLVPRLRARIDAPMQGEIARIRAALPASVRGEFTDAIQRRLLDSADRTGGMVGRDVQNALQGLRDEGRALMTAQASTAYARDLGHALMDVRDLLTANVAQRSTPQVARKFANINAAFARLAQAQRAATSVAAEGGIFTPAMFHQAVKMGDRSARRADFASGRALAQDVSDDAKTIMTRRIADSGTPERAMLAGVIGAGALGMPVETLATAGGLSALYSHLGNRAFQRLATSSPQTRALLRRLILQGTAAGSLAAAKGFE